MPYSGLLAEVLGVIALIVLWSSPAHGLWWLILGLLIAEQKFKGTVLTSIEMYGTQHQASLMWAMITSVTQFIVIGLSVYSFFA